MRTEDYLSEVTGCSGELETHAESTLTNQCERHVPCHAKFCKMQWRRHPVRAGASHTSLDSHVTTEGPCSPLWVIKLRKRMPMPVLPQRAQRLKRLECSRGPMLYEEVGEKAMGFRACGREGSERRVEFGVGRGGGGNEFMRWAVALRGVLGRVAPMFQAVFLALSCCC